MSFVGVCLCLAAVPPPHRPHILPPYLIAPRRVRNISRHQHHSSLSRFRSMSNPQLSSLEYQEVDGLYVPIMSRTRPNIIITGTPGVGKTTHCEMLAEQLGLRHLGINEVIKDKECYVERDEEMQSWVLDEESEDKVCVLRARFLRKGICDCAVVAGCKNVLDLDWAD